MNEYVRCTHCGEEIKRSAKACPHCGSDERTGWSESTYLDGINLPDDEGYEELREREFGKSAPGRLPWQVLTAGFLLLMGVLFLLRTVSGW